MQVFIKYILKSILEKKVRLVLLLSASMISVALLVGALSAYDTLQELLKKQLKEVYGDYNVEINVSDEAEQYFFKSDLLDDVKAQKKLEMVNTTASYEEDCMVTFIGTNIYEVNKMPNFILLEGDNKSIQDKGLIISENTANRFNLKLNDKIELDILDTKKEFAIVGICTNTGLMSRDTSKSFTVIGDIEAITEIYGVESDVCSSALLEVDYGSLTPGEWVKQFNNEKKDDELMAKITTDEMGVNAQLDWLKVPLVCMIVIILIMTIFIMVSTFKLIIIERLPIFGTFLSQGCSYVMLKGLLYTESLMYGMASGMLGCGLGIVVQKIIADAANPLKQYGIKAEVTLEPLYLIAGLSTAMIVALVSTGISLKSLKKHQVKDIILNNNTGSKESSKGSIMGIIFLGIVAVLYCVNRRIDNVGAIPALILFFAGIICLESRMIEIVITGIEKIFEKNFVAGKLALRNIKTSALLKSTILLMTVCLIAITMMISVGDAIINSINDAYSKMNYEINVIMDSKNQQYVETILEKYKEEKRIDKIVSTISFTGHLDGDASKILTMVAVEPEEYYNFETYMYYSDKKQQLDEVGKKEGIILAKQVANNYAIEIGDTVNITYGNKEVRLEVLSILDARMFSDGNYNIISQDTAKKLFGLNYATEYYLSTKGNVKVLMQDLGSDLKGMGTLLYSKDELIQLQKDNISMLTDVLELITFLTILIGAISSFSNVAINCIQRRKELAVLRTVGMTDAKCTYMLILEGISQAIFSLSFAMLSTIIINKLFVGIFEFMEMDLRMKFPMEKIPMLCIGVFGLVMLLSVMTVLKSKRLNVIHEIKYE